MLQEDIKVEKKEAQGFEPLPENFYHVELLDINSKKSNFPTKATEKKPVSEQVFDQVLEFQFTVLDQEFRGRNVWLNFVPTYLYIGTKGKNKLYIVLEALLGRELLQEEEAGMSFGFINDLVGRHCRINLEIKQNQKGKYFNNILKLSKAIAKMQPLTPEEKEKSRVKEKDQPPEFTPSQPEEDIQINPDEVPF